LEKHQSDAADSGKKFSKIGRKARPTPNCFMKYGGSGFMGDSAQQGLRRHPDFAAVEIYVRG